MGLELNWANVYSAGTFEERQPRTGSFDMAHEPSLDERWELPTLESRIPLAEVKKHPHGAVFDHDVRVSERDPHCAAKLQLADSIMMADLHAVHSPGSGGADAEYPVRLVRRRLNKYDNSQLVTLPRHGAGKLHNPLYAHPEDLHDLGLADGQVARLRSPSGAAQAIVEADATLRRGVVALSHGFGAIGPDAEADPRIAGTNVNLLISKDEADAITGLPRMSAIPLSIAPADAAGAERRLDRSEV